MCVVDKMMILQRIKSTIQPLRVGYANRPKMQNMWCFPIVVGLLGFDLTTSPRLSATAETTAILLPSASRPRKESALSHEPPGGRFIPQAVCIMAPYGFMCTLIVTKRSSNNSPRVPGLLEATQKSPAMKEEGGHPGDVIFQSTHAGLKTAKSSPGGHIGGLV